MTSCVAYGCTNRATKNIPGISFHRFPNDKVLKEKWIISVRRKDWTPASQSRLCSVHFTDDSFDLTKKRPTLKKNAIPTVFPGFPEYLQNINKIQVSPTRTKNLQNTPSYSSPNKDAFKKLLQKYKTKQILSQKKIKLLQQTTRRLKGRLNNLSTLLVAIKNQNLINIDDFEILPSTSTHSTELLDRQFSKTKGHKSVKKYSSELRKFPLILHFNSVEMDANSPYDELNAIRPAYRQRKSVFPMIDLDAAIELVLSEVTNLGKEVKSLKESHSFILAEPVIAPHPYPSFRASVKDGYAVIANDSAFENNETAVLKVLGSVTAGCKPSVNVTPGTCMRVNTGGIVPEGADAVVQIEDTKLHQPTEDGEEASIEVLIKPAEHQDIRAVGSDVAEGELLLTAGKRITAAEIGIMSTFGINRVTVYTKPKVAVFSTGDEIVEPDCPDVQIGYVRDSNKSTLCFMLEENYIPFIDAGIVKDNPVEVKCHLIEALQIADIIITTGGVSMGEKDILKQVLMDMGAVLHFGRVKLKPGKPTTFFTLEVENKKKFIFALPGNPVSACVCFYLFVIPCIKKLMGYAETGHKTFKVKLGQDVKLDERPECQRAVLNCGEDGIFIAQSTGSQQSSRLPSMHNADALLMLPGRTDDQPVLKSGTLVDAIFFKSL